MTLLDRVPPEARRVVISMNPKAGAKSGRPKVEELRSRLDELGYDCRLETDIERVASLAAEYLDDGSLRAVVSAGGDGTASLVANETPAGTPILVFPLGTENLLAKHLRFRGRIGQAVDAVSQGYHVKMDAGLANNRLFLLMLGCGFDADVVRRVHSKRRGHIRRWTYFKPILSAIRSYRYPELRLMCQTDEPDHAGGVRQFRTTVRAKWAFVVNLPRYAGGLRVAPQADGHDGYLDVCTFKQGSLQSGLYYLMGVLFRFHKGMRDCRMMKSMRIRIESDEEVPFQIDGDPGGTLPVDVEVLPRRATLLVDAGWASRHGFAYRPEEPPE